MKRVYNFSAGPSVLPEAVLRRAADEMLDYQGSGQSVMEMSHRSKTFDAIIKNTEALLRELMEIPDNYKVLFLQGGASSQFAMIPMNLMTKNGSSLWRSKYCCFLQRQNFLLYSRFRSLYFLKRCRLFPYLLQQYHLRNQIYQTT